MIETGNLPAKTPEGKADLKVGRGTPSSLQKSPHSLVSPSRASMQIGKANCTTPAPIRIEIGEVGAQGARSTYKKMTQLKDVQVKYRNAQSLEKKKKAPTPK